MEPGVSRSSVVRPCDLEIRVRTPWGEGGERLEYVVNSPTGVVQYFQETIRGPRLRSPERFQRQIFEKLEKLARGQDVQGGDMFRSEVGAELLSLGHDLYLQVFGREMKGIYREVRDKVRTLLLISDEPWIPWEILHPFEDDDDFFCMRFQMGRWLTGETTPAAEKRIARALVVDGADPEDSKDLEGAREELRQMRKWIDRTAGVDGLFLSPARHGEVADHLGHDPWDLVHYAGHGLHDQDRAEESQLALEDRPFRVHHLSPEWAPNLRAARPLVVSNACQIGRLGHSLTDLEGWAARWVRRFGCSAFLAPLWSVDDEAVCHFSEALYRELGEGRSLGEAVLLGRHALRERDSGSMDWLAYSLYGHPNLRVLLGDQKPPLEPGAPAASPPISTPRPGPPTSYARPEARSSRSTRMRGPTTSREKGRPSGSRARGGSSPSWRSWPAVSGALLTATAVVWLGVTQLGEPEQTAGEPTIMGKPRDMGDTDPKGGDENPGGGSTAPGGGGTAFAEPSTEPGDSPPPSGLADRKSKPGDSSLPETVEEPVVQSEPPPPPPPAVPLSAIVPGRIGLLVLNQRTGQLDLELAGAMEAAVYDHLPGFSVTIATLSDLSVAARLARGDLSDLPGGGRAPWGVEYLIVASANLEPLPQSNPAIQGVRLAMRAKLISTMGPAIRATANKPHNGIGAMIDTALAQAAERCLSEIFDSLKEE